MNHLLVVPILLPLLTAVALLLVSAMGRAGGGRRVQRTLSVLSTLTLLAAAVALVAESDRGLHDVYRMGAWAAPFGIVLVLDRLSALMVLLTAVVAAGSVLHAVRGSDAESRYFHVLFHMQLTGIVGAFLTGDLFNLFVFFEILLIASYCLLVYGGTPRRVRAGVHYVVLNLLGSALFLVGVGTLYGVTGTLNMADLAVKVAALPAADAGLVRASALLLLVVFGLKAAIVPLSFWLPNTYAAATPAVAALFAIMTKVGVYAIVRVFTLIFGAGAGVAALVGAPWILGTALATLAVGAIGALASSRLRRLQGYLLLTSIGTMLAPVALFSAPALAAALYYLAHSTLTMAAMFLVVDLVAQQRGGTDDRLVRGPTVLQPGVLGALFFLGAVGAAGLPPLSGFLGKALILAATPLQGAGGWIWALVLGGSLLALVALARAGSMVFWNAFTPPDEAPPASRPRAHPPAALLPAAGLLGAVVLLTVLAGPVSTFLTATAEQLLEPRGYIESVLLGTERLP